MRILHTRILLPLIALAFSASALMALGWEEATTQASEAWVSVNSEVDEAVQTMTNRACAEDESGFGVGCTDWVTCQWTDYCYTFQYWPETCNGTGRGYHQANPEQGSSIYAQSTDNCED